MKFFTALDTPLVTRINVTPIIDVALVLVIILLVTAPILAALDFGIDLPQARARNIDNERTLCVTMGRSGQLAIGEDAVARRDFIRRLRESLEESGGDNLLVVVRADAGSSHASVRELVQDIKEAGATRIGLGTRARSEDER
ncbi:MAG: biopolymer transporter ExbD [Candidatus Krumholzibacteriota bacterium]|jgi:biopolymer transport protein TolR|nr:biopolymer transporter ExbD [Candidatus Krumholzibacteriota bacterium]